MFPPESDNGNIEYKRQFDTFPKSRYAVLHTQLYHRLAEGVKLYGTAEAVYYIGVDDNGSISGLKDISPSLTAFRKFVNMADSVEIYAETITPTDVGIYAKFILRRHPKQTDYEIRCALIGNESAGKSTLISVLTHGYPDNGDGSARRSVFRYDHETQTGTTSSINYEVLGFKNNTPINYNSGLFTTSESIIKQSDKIITLIDLPGSPKYFKTTMFGLTAHRPDYVLVVHNSLELSPTTKELVTVCNALHIPCINVMTHIDNAKIDQTDPDMIYLSSVSLVGYDTLHEKLASLPYISRTINRIVEPEFMINAVINIPDIGTVVNGVLNSGSISVDQELLIGPFNGELHPVKILSIHKRQVPCKLLTSGAATFIIQLDPKLRVSKSQMIVSAELVKNFCMSFMIQVEYDVFTVNDYVMAYINNQYVQLVVVAIKDKVLEVTSAKQLYINDVNTIIIRHKGALVVGVCYCV